MLQSRVAALALRENHRQGIETANKPPALERVAPSETVTKLQQAWNPDSPRSTIIPTTPASHTYAELPIKSGCDAMMASWKSSMRRKMSAKRSWGALLVSSSRPWCGVRPVRRAHGTHSNLESWSSSDRKSTRLNSSHRCISYAVFCLKKKQQ